MQNVPSTEERETVWAHFVAGVLSALAMLGTTALAPIVVAMHAHGSGRRFWVLYHGFYIWASALSVIAFAVGLVVGPRRVASIFGHLWGTEQPPNRRISWALQGGVVAIVAVSWWLS